LAAPVPTIAGRTPTPVMGGRSDAVEAKLLEIGGRAVSWFRISGGKHHGAIGTDGAETVERAIRLGLETGVPVVGFLDTSGADIHEGASALHAWGRLAKALADASGVVPTVLAVTGTCVSGPSLLLGLVDVVVMTRESFAYVSGPDSVEEFTGIVVDRMALGSATVHDVRTGVAAFVVDDDDAAADAVADVLEYLPSHSLVDPPVYFNDDPVERDCDQAAAIVPARATAPYDVRAVLDDVLDRDSVLEVRPMYAPNIVTALARLDGRPVGIVANQPSQRAGTIDIEASRKAARFVQWCDAFNLPIITFVDTPGFEPGRDLEWRGMIRHGAELVFAYGEASVPRLCVVLRKAYGGAYIVMDSKGLGNDWCAAWPGAEIAVMGATGAVQILHGRRIAGIAEPTDRAAEHAALVEEYEDRFSNPYRAAERGYVDEVIDPRDTRRQLAGALSRLATKRDRQPRRRHANGPL
jgi:acetyl-CoA carboxylase carboxyltransferase component